MKSHFTNKTIPETLLELQTSEHGLSQGEVSRRIQEYGLNKLPEAKADGWLVIFFRQFQSPLIYILLVAGLIVFLMEEMIDGSIIVFVLFFNALVGTFQEGKAQNTLLALKKFTESVTTVLREGKEIIISDQELVPGDIVILQEGEKVPADARLISADNLKVDESMLTGESAPIHKITDVLDYPELPPAEQRNMVFKGSNVVAGGGRVVVTATGLQTVIGLISKQIVSLDTDIPLKAEIKSLSRSIVIVVVMISVALFGLGLILGEPGDKMFAVVVSLAVSVIPEGLPIVMTLVLATGVWRMSKRNALVKKLQAVEALGQAKVIAVDKTGTLTRNEMVVERVFVDNKIFKIGGLGYEPKGEVKLDDNIVDASNHPELLLVGKIAAFCSGARLMYAEDKQEWKITGDPTEAATLVLAEKIGFYKDDLERESPRIMDLPFNYQVKYHAAIHKVGGENLLSVVGAPEMVLGLSNKIWQSGTSNKLDEKDKENIEQTVSVMAEDGLRVVALAMRLGVDREMTSDDVSGLTFVGLVGIIDTLRPEAKEAVKRANEAGIKVVMITGDHQSTARAIAKQAGIYNVGDLVVTGQEIDSWTEVELAGRLSAVSVFARVTPDHKLQIVNAYKKRGEIIAMTGDGVNDAPSLVAADLGVAMGKIGTEVAKEAADIILLDDNFGSIISAVEEGRNIYKTIKKVILYLFSTSLGEVMVITGALLLGLPLPILAAQIIWLNLVTDGFLDMALGMEPKEQSLLRGQNNRSGRRLVDWVMFGRMVVMATPMTLGTLFIFNEYIDIDMTKAWTMSLTTLAAFQWFNAWNCRSDTKSIFQLNPFSNKFLVGATVLVVSLQLLAVYNPFFQSFLRTTALSGLDWLFAVAVAASVIVTEEIRKSLSRKDSIVYPDLSTKGGE